MTGVSWKGGTKRPPFRALVGFWGRPRAQKFWRHHLCLRDLAGTAKTRDRDVDEMSDQKGGGTMHIAASCGRVLERARSSETTEFCYERGRRRR